MTLGLAMIVRDEEHDLPRCLASLPAQVDPGRSLIVDTGSRDRTKKIAADWGAEVVDDEWHGHARNRTALMTLARGRADHLMLLDADMELVWEEPALEPLTGEICMARIVNRNGNGGEQSYPLPVIVDGRIPWKYEGAAHAALAHADDRVDLSLQKLRSFTIRDHSTFDPSKVAADIEALWKELHGCAFANPRAWYYLGQSYLDLGEKQMALTCFSLRATAGGMEEERWNAVYQAGLILSETNFAAGMGLLAQAFQQRPFRAEPLRALAALADAYADTLPFPEDEVMPVRGDLHGPRP